MSGVTANLIRAYENMGLLRPYREPSSNYRLFTEDEIEWIKRIKYLINEVGLNIEGIKAFLTVDPCWEVRNCSEEAQKTCEAFKKINLPCWSIKSQVECCDKLECYKCEYFIRSRQHRKLQPIEKQNKAEDTD